MQALIDKQEGLMMITSDTIPATPPAAPPPPHRSGVMVVAPMLAVLAIAALAVMLILKVGQPAGGSTAGSTRVAYHAPFTPAQSTQAVRSQRASGTSRQAHATTEHGGEAQNQREAQDQREARNQRETQDEREAQARQQTQDGPLTQFNGQIASLLSQSSPAYREINHVFAAMQAAADGENPGMTVDQADASLSDVIANRSGLAAAARALDAPTAEAVGVRDALSRAMEASLTNDTDIQNCLDEDRSGSVAVIFRSCLSSTAGSDDAATEAKRDFWNQYDHLRGAIGLGPDETDF